MYKSCSLCFLNKVSSGKALMYIYFMCSSTYELFMSGNIYRCFSSELLPFTTFVTSQTIVPKSVGDFETHFHVSGIFSQQLLVARMVHLDSQH